MVETGLQGNIVIDSVTRVFCDITGSEITALEPVDLNIKPGEFICLIGPSGCGKSTLLRLIAGLDSPTSGNLLIDGEPITGTHYSRGFVFQDPTLFPWKNIWENVASGLEARGVLKEKKSEVNEFLNLVGLEEFAKVHPHQLSGGMAQRVALARALINHPKVLLLDEPLGALDAFTRMNMQDEILRIWQQRKTTMLFVTHDIDEAVYLADRVVIMTPRPGKVKEVIEIPLGRPRNRNSTEFFRYRSKILEIFHLCHEPDNDYII